MEGAKLRGYMAFEVDQLLLVEAFIRRTTSDTYHEHAAFITDPDEKLRVQLYFEYLKALLDANKELFEREAVKLNKDNDGGPILSMALNMMASRAQEFVTRFLNNKNAMH